MIVNGLKTLAVGSVFLLLGGCVVGSYPDGYVVRETSYSYTTDSGPWYRVARHHHHKNNSHAHYGPPRKAHESHAHYGPPKKHRDKSGAHYGPPGEKIPSVSVTS